MIFFYHCQYYSWMCVASKKVQDGWVKEERKIDGYGEKKMLRNSPRETERWTEKQTDREDCDRVQVQDRKKEWERIKETTTEAQSPLSPLLLMMVGCGVRDLAQVPTAQPLSKRPIYTVHPVRDKVTVNHITVLVDLCVCERVCQCVVSSAAPRLTESICCLSLSELSLDFISFIA